MTGPVGLLPYGSTDSSVIFRRNLLARPTAAGTVAGDVGTCTVVDEGSGASYDPVAGLYNIGTNAVILSAINGSSAAMAALAGGGQIRFEVPTAWMACSNAISQGSSGGNVHGGEYAICLRGNPYINPNYSHTFASASSNATEALAGYGTNVTSSGAFFSDAIGQSGYTPIVMALRGNKVETYANGVLLNTLTKPNTILLPFDSIVLGRYAGGGGNLNVGRIRNLQISNKPVTFSVPRNLSSVAVFGDSYANATNIYQAASYNLEKTMTMRSVLNAVGWDWGAYNSYDYGGRRVIGSDGTWRTADSAATYLAPNCATMLAARPSVVIFQAGANDLSQADSMSQANFTTSLRGFVEQCFGLNGNAATDTRKIILCTTPWAPASPDAAQAVLRKPDITKIFSAAMSIPAWFNTTYPSRAGDVSVCDSFTAFGGFNPVSPYWDSGDLIHPSPRGRYIMGTAWGNAALLLVNT